MDHLDARQPDPLDTGDLGDLDHQFAELEPPLRVAIVADADTGQHHLRLALESTRRRASSSTADSGRERASPRTVGMMQ